MEEFRAVLRKNLGSSKKKKEKKGSEVSERIASRLEALMWPEKAFEIKRQRRMNEVYQEAEDG